MYSIGEIANKLNASVRTVRFYDEKGILSPVAYTEKGYRLYNDESVERLRLILILRSCGFTIDEIIDFLRVQDNELLKRQILFQTLKIKEEIKQKEIQLKYLDLLQKQDSLGSLEDAFKDVNHKVAIEKQFEDENNLKSRISIHDKYSMNEQGWFDWVASQTEFKDGMRILDIGCGNGEFWIKNKELLNRDIQIVLSDTSEGMLADAKKRLGHYENVTFVLGNVNDLPFKEGDFDIVLAFQMLYFVENIHQALFEIKRVLNENGVLYSTTIGQKHTHEIVEMMHRFDQTLNLSNEPLHRVFGLENCMDSLDNVFDRNEMNTYNDALDVTDYMDLVDYIYSTHGNAVEQLRGRFNDFEQFVSNNFDELNHHFYVTKQLGIIKSLKK